MKRDPVAETAADDLPQGSKITPHVGWITTSLVFLLVVVKVSVVAHFNLSTALGLIASSSAPSVVVGVLTASLSGIVGYLFFVSLLLTLKGRQDVEAMMLRGLSVTFGLLATFLAPVVAAPMFFVSMQLTLPGPLSRLLRRRAKRRFEQSPLNVEARALWKRGKESDVGARVEARRARVNSLHEAAQETLDEVRRDVEQRGSDVPELQTERLERLAEAEKAVELSRAEVAKFDEDLADAEQLLKDMEDFTAKLDAAAAAEKVEYERKKKLLLAFAVVYGVVTVILTLASDTPWLPPERLAVGGGETVGFVVLDRDGTDLVLHDEPRHLEWVDVQERTICARSTDDLPWFLTSPSDLVFGRQSPPYPDCDEEQSSSETTS